ncbi:hypothetical protein ABDI30_02200 [Paenibacillus cisolokensis]|uniref:Group-specific protein n=1 Tax=Paenibacillus campinasensis TaxID=66347 RepID=A0ABW9T8M7_9BACL|nr:hypothetical protein [Paenibacillus campinasensis]MUG68967.1 hypothetical protein [Paenibacillus campinasensis]
MKLTSIHKKIRGMRKKARKLETWADYHKQLHVDSLLQYNKEYVKLWISPFYNLYQINPNLIGRKNPPYKFRRQVFYQLIEIYVAWQEQLEQLNQPYYLKIWLGDPEFMDSQIVAAINDEIDYYNHIFMDHEEHKDFPLKIHHPLMDRFVWKRCVNGYVVWESDLETAQEVNEIQNKAFKTFETEVDGRIERSYFMKTGDMWVGSMRRSGNTT